MKDKFKKYLKIILLVIILIIAVFFGVPKYYQWQKWLNLKKQAAEFEREQRELEQKIASDTYGGKTPQETLEFFIAAVEKGDYELASKYFVVEKQEEWENKLQLLPDKNIKWLVDNLKTQIQDYIGHYSSDKKRYIIEKPAFTEFIIYPSGIWKINEI